MKGIKTDRAGEDDGVINGESGREIDSDRDGGTITVYL